MIQHVSDTALWVAWCRALESRRPDALFRDPFAERLAGEKGRRIAESMESTARYTQWTLAIRTVIIDQWIEMLLSEGVDLVLNLGAGLDARPYRMELPSSLLWIEVDHAHIIEHKEAVLAPEKPRCQLERVRLDLSDLAARKALLERVCQRGKKVLVITEGVLPYLTEQAVGELASDLHACERFQYWIAEYFAKEVYRYINTRARLKRMGNAPFRFLPEDWFGFFAARGWRERETRYLAEESARLGRKTPGPWLMFIFRLLASQERRRKLGRMTGYTIFTSAQSARQK